MRDRPGRTPPILIVPGYLGSEPEHWQSVFERKLASARHVEMPSWTQPRRDAWLRSLTLAVAACEQPPVIVAHSLGCIAVAHWATSRRQPVVAAALLVAPCDVERRGLPDALRDFAPLPRARLAFPSLLAASSDDPYLEVERARELADHWGSHLRVLGDRGHINVSSGFGPWLEGETLLAELLQETSAARRREPPQCLDADSERNPLGAASAHLSTHPITEERIQEVETP